MSTASFRSSWVAKSCYLAYPYGLDIAPVINALQALDVRPIDATDLAPGTLPLADSIQDQISRADMVIAVVGGTTRDRPVLFELGLARGLGKRTVVIAPPRVNLPAELTGVPTIRLNLKRHEGLVRAVQRALNLPRGPAALSELTFPSRPLGVAADRYVERFQQLVSSAPIPGELERLLAEALTATGAVVELTHRSPSDDRPDFILWHNELESTLGNPILVEINYNASDALAASHHLARYMSDTGTNWGLLLFAVGTKLSGPTTKPLAPGVLLMAISELLSDLRYDSLPQVITRERNRVMHGIRS